MPQGDPDVWDAFEETIRRVDPVTLRRLAWIGLACAVAITVLSLLNLAVREFGPLRSQAIQVDELYFAACAARGTVTGLTIAGCHDSKAPVIHMLYQAVQAGHPPYDIVAVKIAAFVTVAAIMALAGLLAWQFGGAVAALVACALLLQALSSDASVMAFKTDSVGAVFMLAGLACLTQKDGHRRAVPLMLAGLLVGLAAVTKQTYAIVALAVVAWLSMSSGTARPSFATIAARSTLFIVPMLLPFSLLLARYALESLHVDYLASFFLYPLVYGGPNSGLSPHELASRLANVLDTLSDSTLLAVLSAVATMLWLARGYRRTEHARPRMLVLLCALLILVVMVLAPYHFTYHAVPAWALLAIVAGTVVGDAWPPLRKRPQIALGISGVLLVSAVLAGASSWHTNGGRRPTDEHEEAPPLVQASANRYAYVLGTWPDFYVYNGLVPASDVMFPWALPGTPPNWSYTPPQADSWRGRVLRYVQARGIARLFDDFMRTPPSYILVLDDMARQPDSEKVTDVPGFDAYLRERCTYDRTVYDKRRGLARLFRCGAGGNRAPAVRGRAPAA
jgi:hypothetical protein